MNSNRFPSPFDTDGVRGVSRVELRVVAEPWPWAQARRIDINAHWARAIINRPNYFNGVVHLAKRATFDGDTLTVDLIATDFKSYLFWRETGFADTGVVDPFGSALVQSLDRQSLIVCQRPGNINSGLYYLPGGFIDDCDVEIGADGLAHVDIAKSIAREVLEETGLRVGEDVIADGGFIVTRTGPHMSIAQVLRSVLSGAQLLQRVEGTIAADPDGELAAARLVQQPDDLTDIAMTAYARMLMDHVLTRR